ncbi:MAG: porin [Caulobacteraceae bacterium]
MRNKSALAASVTLGAVVALGIGSGAQAKSTRHHHPRAGGPSGEEVELKAEVEALKSQVQSLESRLDSQDRTEQRTAAQVQATQAQAQTAQNQAQAAQVQAQAAQSRIETIPSDITTAVAKATPKKGWEANTKIGGTMFGDVSYIHNTADGLAQPDDGVNYDIKRFYLSVDHRFNDVFAANVTTDFTYDSGPASATQLYLKKAYVEAKLSDALVIRLGSADLPWIPFVEGVYGYRYVENALIDRTRFGTSADWGVHLSGSLANGLLSYAVSAVDGAGYKKPAIGAANRTHAIDVEGRVSANLEHFTVAVGGYSGKLGHDVVGAPTFHTAQRLDALAAYTNARFRIGGEYFWARDWNDVTQANPALTNTSDGFSAFGSFNFTPRIAIFGRYDWVKPKKDTSPSETDNYFNVGLSYQPVEIVDFALVYKRDKVDNGLFSTSNGVIGGLRAGTYDEIGLFTQVKF